MNEYGTGRAINELKAIFACQWRNGLLPQIRFAPGGHGYRPDAGDWGVTPEISGPTPLRTSGITQPPIMGLCAYEVFKRIGEEAQNRYAADFTTMCTSLERYHHWLLTERDPWGDSLALCLHPWETGTDNSPAFDPLIESTRAYIEAQNIAVDTFGRADTVHVKGEQRPTARDYYAYFGLMSLFKAHGYKQAAIIEHTPFLLQDVLFNTLLVASLHSLARLQDALSTIQSNRESRFSLEEKAYRNLERGDTVARAIRQRLWSEDDGFFYSYDAHRHTLLATPTVSGFMPLMSNVANREQADRLVRRLVDPGGFGTQVPVPSTSPQSPSFDPQRYWSGPSWPVTNWLVLRGLCARKLPEARQLREQTLDMIAEGAGREQVAALAGAVLEHNSYGEEFTTPSRKQYAHAWLWDSAIVALSWPLVREKPEPYVEAEGEPRFWEYYQPHTGEPLGAQLMSWTASLFLEVLAME